jgi:hypothetical protein
MKDYVPYECGCVEERTFTNDDPPKYTARIARVCAYHKCLEVKVLPSTFCSYDFKGSGERCESCGGTISEHRSITFSGRFTEKELADPKHPHHEQYLRLKNRENAW